ncbi:MAG: hypothetical protein B0W54_24020 [Cellvibrio sp. 79]|nr:MAG: hypothetical protein B0W54_24020 [Cellvibrio sp. 79]
MKKLLKLSMLSSSLALGIMASGGVSAQGACKVDYTTVNNWGAGAQYRVTITNTSAAKSNWELCWTFNGNEVVNNLWDGTFTASGKNICVKNVGYNGNLPTGGTASFGFLVNNPGTSPTAFTLNGASCGGTPSSSSIPSSIPSSSSSSRPSSIPSSSSSSSNSNVAARWLLDGANSTFHFVTVKKNNAGTETPENITFSQLEGTVSPTGQATLTIPLVSVSSGIDLRNTRLKEILFEAQYLPSLHFTTQLDLTTIDGLAAGSTSVQTITGNLTLHGVVKSVNFDALIVKHANNSISVSPRKPIVINATDFDLNFGLESLRTIMALTSIGEKVPVYFKVFLSRDNPTNVPVITLATAPATPLSLTGTSVTTGANLNWADASSNETGFLVRRKGADGRWATANNAPANTVSYLDTLTEAGAYDYKVISYKDSVPSAATGSLNIVFTGGNTSTPSSSSAISSSSSSSFTSVSTTSSSSSRITSSSSSSSSVSFIGDPVTGGNLFATVCSGCHKDNDGDGRFDDGAIKFDVNAFTYPASYGYTGTSVQDLSSFISNVMFRQASCTSANCADHLAAYLWSLKGRDLDTAVACDATQPVQYGLRSLKLLTSYEYRNSLQALFTQNLTADYSSRELANTDKLVNNLPNHISEPITETRLLSYKANAEKIATWALANNALRFTCSDKQSTTCATSFIDNFAYPAFRRPLTTEERTEYTAIVRNSPEGLRWAIQTVLMSPQFLYKTELGVTVAQAKTQSWGTGTTFNQASSTAYALDPYEFASALSYMYTAAPPDSTLLQAAANGSLENPTQLATQIDRLMDSALGKEHVGRLAGMWFRTDAVTGVSRMGDATFNDSVKQSMAQEIREMYKYVFYNNLPITDLYKGDFTVLNSTLSQYYGISGGGTSATDWRMVNTAGTPRGGVLASGAFMTANAHSGRTSPILRAVHVRQDLLCQNIPLPTSFEDTTGERDKATARAQMLLEAGNLTTTEFYNIQTNVQGTICFQCHRAIINPLFALDDFNNVGKPRAKQNGKVVQPALDLNGNEARSNLVEINMVNNGGVLYGATGYGPIDFDDVNAEHDTGRPGLPFTGAKGLANVLISNNLPGINACLINKSYRFATGHALSNKFYAEGQEPQLSRTQEASLACVNDNLTTTLAGANNNPRALMKAIGLSKSLRFRQ